MSLTKIAKSFSKGAYSYDQSCLIHQKSAQQFMPAVQRCVQEPKSILDVGCGTGLMGFYLKQAYPKAYLAGIDIAEGMIEKAALKQVYDKLMRQNALEHQNKYDLIVAHFSLQWFPDFIQAITYLIKHCHMLAFVVPLSTSFSSWKSLYPESLYPLPDLCDVDFFASECIYTKRRSYPMMFEKPVDFAKYLKALGANFKEPSSVKMIPKKLFAHQNFTTNYEVIEVVIKGKL